MGFFSKLWKGVKKTVKAVARTVKKVSKAVITSMPGGDKIWEFGTKIGKGIQKGLGKIAGKLGPIGTMALSFVLAPIMGPAISALWSGFGAGAAAMAATGSGIVSALGTAGTAIFNGVNFVSGTVGALGKALTEGVAKVAKGNFGAAGNSFITNMKSAFSGEAGMANLTSKAAAAQNTVTMNSFKDTFGGLKSPAEVLKGKPLEPIDTFDIGIKTETGEFLRPTMADINPVSIPEVGPIAPGAREAAEAAVNLPQISPTDFSAGPVANPVNPVATGEGTVLKPVEAPTFLDGAKESLSRAKTLAGSTSGGAGEASGFEAAAPYDVGSRTTDLSRPGEAKAIQAAGGGGNSLWAQLIAQAGQQTRGGFA